MSHLVPQQRPDVNGRLVTRHVLAEKPVPVSRSPIPAVGLTLAPAHLQKSFSISLSNPEQIKWERYSKDDVEKIAEFASNEMEFTADSEGMFKLYTEMFKSEHLDPNHVRELMERNNVLKRVKSVFMEANGLETEDEWTPDQYQAREEYIKQYAAFNEAAIASGAIEGPK